MEIQNQMFGKQMFAGPYREKGTQRGIFFLSTMPSICSGIVSSGEWALFIL